MFRSRRTKRDADGQQSTKLPPRGLVEQRLFRLLDISSYFQWKYSVLWHWKINILHNAWDFFSLMIEGGQWFSCQKGARYNGMIYYSSVFRILNKCEIIWKIHIFHHRSVGSSIAIFLCIHTCQDFQNIKVQYHSHWANIFLANSNVQMPPKTSLQDAHAPGSRTALRATFLFHSIFKWSQSIHSQIPQGLAEQPKILRSASELST